MPTNGKKNKNNYTVSINGNTLTITVDLSKEIGESKSGKNISVASTKGNVELSNGMYLGLNVYKDKD